MLFFIIILDPVLQRITGVNPEAQNASLVDVWNAILDGTVMGGVMGVPGAVTGYYGTTNYYNNLLTEVRNEVILEPQAEIPLEQVRQEPEVSIVQESTYEANKKAEIIWPNKPHTNGTEGHWETIQQKVGELVDSGNYDKLYVNKGISNEIPNAQPNRRPDIMGVQPNGKIDQFEIPSKTDTIQGLYDRMNNSKKILGNRAGNIEVVPIRKRNKP